MYYCVMAQISKLFPNCYDILLYLAAHIHVPAKHIQVPDLSDYIYVYQVELVSIAYQAGATLSSLVQRGQELVDKLQSLQVDRRELACLKFLILFNPGKLIYVTCIT